jgi:prepilin-type N-terminal cleavage/methylation domain-containing protein
MRNNKGFTLIEVIITSVILVVVILVIYSSFYTGIFGYRDIEEHLDIYQSAGKIFNRLDLDLSNSFKYNSTDFGFNGTQEQMRFFTVVDKYRGENISQSYSFVSYRWDAANNTVMRLCRTDKDALNQTSDIEPEEIAVGIEAFSLSYGYQDPNKPDVLQFNQTWSDPLKFPLAVNVTMSIKQKNTQNFERTIYLPLAKN